MSNEGSTIDPPSVMAYAVGEMGQQRYEPPKVVTSTYINVGPTELDVHKKALELSAKLIEAQERTIKAQARTIEAQAKSIEHLSAMLGNEEGEEDDGE